MSNDMIKKITRGSVGEDLFKEITDDAYDTSYSEHRRGSNFYTRWVFEVNEKYFPEHPEFWGFWESNDFIFDTDYGFESSEITELTRVEKKTKTIVEEYWEKVE
jgi:hypothetical protein